MRYLSIRGRVAFAAACVEVAMRHFDVNHLEARAFLKTLWNFTLSENLLDWEEQIQALHPIHWQEIALTNLELRVQPVLQDLFANAIAVGTRNLYSDYRSLETEESLNDVVQQMQALKLELPDLELFRFSEASEAKGWGVAFDPNELQANLKRGII
jgi:hypothetical protein